MIQNKYFKISKIYIKKKEKKHLSYIANFMYL